MFFVEPKGRLLTKVHQLHKDFVSTIHRSLLGADIQYIQSRMTGDDATNEVVEIESFSVTAGVYRNLLPAQPLSTDCMRAIMMLFKSRCSRICATHKEVHENEPNPKRPVDTSIFFTSVAEAEEEMVQYITASVASVYILWRDVSNNWCLFFIDLRKGIVYYINPAFGLNEFDEANATLMNRSADRVKAALSVKYPDDDPFECQCFPYQFYQPNEDDFNSGVYVFMILYHLEMRSPIHMRRLACDKMRNNLGYWMLIKQLPC